MKAEDALFSRRGVLAGGALAILSPQVVRGSQANSKISVGLIGSGGRGSYDAAMVNADPRARVTALCDLYDDRLERAAQQIKAPEAKLYKDFEKLLASPDIDAVVIATPPFEHPRMLEAAVEAGKHVYCEKPAGVDLEGVKRVIAAGRKCDPKKNISFGFQQRYGPVYLEAYKRFKEGQIGSLTNARGFWIVTHSRAFRTRILKWRNCGTGLPIASIREILLLSRIATIWTYCIGSWTLIPFARSEWGAARCARTWRSWII